MLNAGLMTGLMMHYCDSNRLKSYIISLGIITNDFDGYRKCVLKSQTNNWLKMHGYPMKRKYRP